MFSAVSVINLAFYTSISYDDSKLISNIFLWSCRNA